MLKVLIVEDEFLIRQLIKNSLDWTDLGMIIVGEAEDGEQAREILKEVTPEIIIMDINIPFVNGIDLSLEISSAMPSVKIVILSGYSDFQYARKAIHAGVYSYLLKPLDSDEMSRTLKKLADKIYRENDENRILAKDYEMQKRQAMGMLCNKLVSETPGETDDYYRERGLSLPQKRFYFLLIMSEVAVDPPEVLPADVLFAFTDKNQHICFLIDAGSNRLAGKKGQIRRISEELKISGISVHHLSAGSTHEGTAHIPLAYREACRAMEYVHLKESGLPVYFEDLGDIDSSSLPVNLYSRAPFSKYLRSRDFKSLESHINQIFERLSLQYASRSLLIFVAHDIISVFNDYLNEIHGEKDDIPSIPDLLEPLKECAVLSDYKQAVQSVLNQTEASLSLCSSSRTGRILDKVKLQIRDHFKDRKMGLESLAAYAGLHPSYLSQIFKKECGISLNEYITRVRLEYARRLLDEGTDYSISDLSYQSGYNDPYYFSKCFKKIFGVNPSKYRNNRI